MELRKQWEAKGQATPPLPLPSELHGLILRLLCESGMEQEDLRPCLHTLRAMGRVCRFFCLVLASVIAQLPEAFRRRAAHFEAPLLEESACTNGSGQDLRQWAGNFLAARWELKQDPPSSRLRSAFYKGPWLPASVLGARCFDPLPEEIDLCALNSERLDEWESVVEKCGDRVLGLRIADTVPDREQEVRQAGSLALCLKLRRLTIRSWVGSRARANYSWMKALGELRELRIESPRWPPIPAAVLRGVEQLCLSRTQWDALCDQPEMLDCFQALKTLQILGDDHHGQPLYLPAGLTHLSNRFFSEIDPIGAGPVPDGLTGLELRYPPRDEEQVSYGMVLRRLSSHTCPPSPMLCRVLESKSCRLRSLRVKYGMNEERALFSALARNRSLTELQLDTIYLMQEHLDPLAEFLRRNPALQVLRLTFSVRRMWLDQLKGLIDAIASHPGLRVVSLDFDKLQSSLHHYDNSVEQQLLLLPGRNPGLLELDFKLRPRERGLLTFRFLRRAYLRDEPVPT